MKKELIKIPSLGGAERLDVLEICVQPGDIVEAQTALVALVSDSASMEVPSPRAGKVVEVKLKVGDVVSEGDAIVVLETKDEKPAEPAQAEDQRADERKSEEPQAEQYRVGAISKGAPSVADPGSPERTRTISVPDIGGDEEFDVIKVYVKKGSEVAEGDCVAVLESDTASMEVPAPHAGTVIALKVNEGDKVRKGGAILELAVIANGAVDGPQGESKHAAPLAASRPQETAVIHKRVASGATLSAGPAVRKLARELGIDLQKVVSDRIQGGSALAAGGAGIPAVPDADFAEFGQIKIESLSKLHKMTAANMRSSWLNVPHVTQFDDADITDLEDARASLKSEAEVRRVKLTPLPFLIKACAAALRAHPKVNASLLSDGERIVNKQYVHIGIAVDTPVGLMVPVLRDADRKSVWELAAESAELAAKAKNRKLSLAEMQGGCFTISSLGNIGGLGFTPIVNTPEVAILGVSRLTIKPVWNGGEFVPRKMLPLSLSYDHRAINGADAGTFLTHLRDLLADMRRLVP